MNINNSKQGVIQDKSERCYIGRNYSVKADILLCILAIIILGFAVHMTLESVKNPVLLIVVIPILFGFILSITYIGGLIYEIKAGNILIKSGLLRLPLKRILISDVQGVVISDYNVIKSAAFGWYNKFPGDVKGYVRGFRGKAVLINCKDGKYLLASDDPESMKMKIEEYLAGNDK